MIFPGTVVLRHLTTLLLLCSVLSLFRAQAADAPPPVETPAPAVLLAEHYHPDIHPADYWISEKLDGVRAMWDGKTLRFRSGRTIHAPAWFIHGLPPHPLDGELWMGRGQFENVSGAVRREIPQDAEWKKISYQIFEWPDAPGTFSERLAALKTSIARANVPWLHLIEQFRITDRQALQTKLEQVVRKGGEGLMLHRADALWQTGRTDALLKLKTYDDAEARVLAHLPGKGKYEGLCGALLVETPDGKRFRLGSGLTDAQRRSPPPIGSRVTYRYRGFTVNGLPRFATFMRIRPEE